MREEPQRGLAFDVSRTRSWTHLASLGLPGLAWERRAQSWSGGGCTGNGACQVTLKSNTVITATFTNGP